MKWEIWAKGTSAGTRKVIQCCNGMMHKLIALISEPRNEKINDHMVDVHDLYLKVINWISIALTFFLKIKNCPLQ